MTKIFKTENFLHTKTARFAPGRFFGLSSLKWMDLCLFYDEFYGQMV